MKHLFICCFICVGLLFCKQEHNKIVNNEKTETLEIDKNSSHPQQKNYRTYFKENPTYISNGFDFPVGRPDAKGYYNAQKFQENNHLGDDWNGVGGGNTDLGNPIYAIGNGYISEVKDYKGGWGNVVRIVHLYNNKLYESLYAHCDTVLVAKNKFIKRGGQIATIGNCNGAYLAHLHLEIRDKTNLDIGGGYSSNTSGYLNPTDYINKHRN